jgi:hypothetical protein
VRVTKANNIGFGTGLAKQGMNEFLKFLEGMVADTNLYSLVTPDFTYLNANLKGYDYKREINNGASIIMADLHFVEILSAQISTTNSNSTTAAPATDGGQSPSAAATTDNGSVAGNTVPPSSAAASNAAGSM